MSANNVATNSRRIKGGPTARAIYSPGGLADRLRAARRHNTADRTMSAIGRPAANDDGTRTYLLVLEADPSPPRQSGLETTCPRCGADDPGFIDCDDPDCPVRCDVCSHETTLAEWAGHLGDVEVIDPIDCYCPDCGCPVGTPGQCVVGDHLATCHCDCHEDDAEDAGDDHQAADTAGAEVVTYRGVRTSTLDEWNFCVDTKTRITRDGEQLPYRQDLIGGVSVYRDWGPRAASSARRRLALDLACDVLDDDDRALAVYEVLAEALIQYIVGDEWTMTSDQLLHGIEAIERTREGGEVSR